MLFINEGGSTGSSISIVISEISSLIVFVYIHIIKYTKNEKVSANKKNLRIEDEVGVAREMCL